MTKVDDERPSPAESEPTVRPDDDFVPDDALPLCSKCLKPCHPLQYYCDKCDSYDAINPLTPYIPYVNIWFNYNIFFTMWRKLCGEDEKPIIIRLFYLLFIVAFFRIMVVVGIPTPWSPAWFTYCERKYGRFDRKTGRYYRGGRWVACR